MSEVYRPTIYLDMDGVLSNFVLSALRLHCPNGWKRLMETWPKGVFEIYDVIDISGSDFWGTINMEGWKFWSELEPFPWAMPLYNTLKELGDVVVLTSPSRNPNCAKGKILWLQHFFMEGYDFRDYILAPSQFKHHVAAFGRILVDDSSRNIKRFNKAGGCGVLVPQPWNDGPEVAASDMVKHITDRVCVEIARLIYERDHAMDDR